MFYCEPCRVEEEWPNSISQSYGQCELCNNVEVCWNRPSSSLPDSKSYKEYKANLEKINLKIQEKLIEKIARAVWSEFGGFDGTNTWEDERQYTKDLYLDSVRFIIKMYKEK